MEEFDDLGEGQAVGVFRVWREAVVGAAEGERFQVDLVWRRWAVGDGRAEVVDVERGVDDGDGEDGVVVEDSVS